jgi:hypothetical protein
LLFPVPTLTSACAGGDRTSGTELAAAEGRGSRSARSGGFGSARGGWRCRHSQLARLVEAAEATGAGDLEEVTKPVGSPPAAAAADPTAAAAAVPRAARRLTLATLAPPRAVASVSNPFLNTHFSQGDVYLCAEKATQREWVVKVRPAPRRYLPNIFKKRICPVLACPVCPVARRFFLNRHEFGGGIAEINLVTPNSHPNRHSPQTLPPASPADRRTAQSGGARRVHPGGQHPDGNAPSSHRAMPREHDVPHWEEPLHGVGGGRGGRLARPS